LSDENFIANGYNFCFHFFSIKKLDNETQDDGIIKRDKVRLFSSFHLCLEELIHKFF
jgi:hypothetical protein